MSGVKFKVHTDGMDDTLKNIARAATMTQQIVAQQVLKDTSPYVPARAESLDQRSRVNGNLVIYPGPYSRFLYYGKLMIDPDTGSSWAPLGASKVVTGKDLDIKQTVHPKAQSHWFEASKAQNMETWEHVAAKTVGEELG